MLLSIIAVAFTLSRYALLIQHLLSIKYNWLFELCMVTGMLFFQYPFIYKRTWKTKLDYYFYMLLVSLMGGILLWPVIIVNHFDPCTDLINIVYFFAVVWVMFWQHKKIVQQLLLPVFISYTWVLYRLIILIFIV
ncbi:hypothetical protein [Ferruginibacter sp.]